MRIVILAMDDPLYTNQFIKQIIDKKQKDIVGFFYVSKGNRMTIRKDQSRISYMFALFLIMGPVYFILNSLTTLRHKFQCVLSQKTRLIPDPMVKAYSEKKGIPSFQIGNPNHPDSLCIIRDLRPDVIINQSQSIIKKSLIDIAQIGVINRHNALLPRNRGRLTPFWILYNNEVETGVSIHFVNEGIDDGDIIIQKKYKVRETDTFNSLVKKNYKLADSAIIEALDKLSLKNCTLIQNDINQATYNTTPDIRHAWTYRKKRILSRWNLKIKRG